MRASALSSPPLRGFLNLYHVKFLYNQNQLNDSFFYENRTFTSDFSRPANATLSPRTPTRKNCTKQPLKKQGGKDERMNFSPTNTFTKLQSSSRGKSRREWTRQPVRQCRRKWWAACRGQSPQRAARRSLRWARSPRPRLRGPREVHAPRGREQREAPPTLWRRTITWRVAARSPARVARLTCPPAFSLPGSRKLVHAFAAVDGAVSPAQTDVAP